MAIAKSRIETDKGSRYLQQLCKHFGHKIPVEFTPQAGSIQFEMGRCALAADPTGLDLQVEGEDEAKLQRLEEVVARHLERFAFREELKIVWVRA
jgi:hypothetical protein